MIVRIVSIVFFGAIFGLFPLILFYGGVFVNYFNYYGIREFFNSFFMNNINVYLYAIFGLFCGIAFVVNTNALRFLYLICLIALSLTFVPNIGKKIGDRMFLRENARIIVNGETAFVRVIYRDKYKVYYNTKENPTIIRVNL